MEREPDMTEDPRDADVGQGYPEEQPDDVAPESVVFDAS